MLTVRPKIADLNFVLFGRSIHPELFNSCATRTISRENYSLDLTITGDGHLFVFRHNGLVLAEVSAGSLHPLPERRQLIKHAIKGPQVDEIMFRDQINYSCQFQRESVSPKLVLAIQQQLSDQSDAEGLIHRFQSSGRMAFGAVSYINIQAFRYHVNLRSFHTFPDSCSIIKSESTFRIKQASAAA